jgi:hypothetical protein
MVPAELGGVKRQTLRSADLVTVGKQEPASNISHFSLCIRLLKCFHRAGLDPASELVRTKHEAAIPFATHASLNLVVPSFGNSQSAIRTLPHVHPSFFRSSFRIPHSAIRNAVLWIT